MVIKLRWGFLTEISMLCALSHSHDSRKGPNMTTEEVFAGLDGITKMKYEI